MQAFLNLFKYNDPHTPSPGPLRGPQARRTQPGIFPLAHGIADQVGLLRGYGNAIVPRVAAVFIEAYLEVKGIT
jgi:hypothetical protein